MLPPPLSVSQRLAQLRAADDDAPPRSPASSSTPSPPSELIDSPPELMAPCATLQLAEPRVAPDQVAKAQAKAAAERVASMLRKAAERRAADAKREEILAQAAAEGLTLQRSDRSSTGFRNVYRTGPVNLPYQPHVRRDGESKVLGSFATAEEAAMCLARSPEGQAAAAAALPRPPPMTANEALRVAEAEGLTLRRSAPAVVHSTGFISVYRTGTAHLPYQAQVCKAGMQKTLGTFATAEQAALEVARFSKAKADEKAEAEAAGRSPVEPAQPPPLTPAQQEAAQAALQQAEAEGLRLQRSERCSTGFKNVVFDRNSGKKPYLARLQREGKPKILGHFGSAEQAAVAIARWLKEEQTQEQAAVAAEQVPMIVEAKTPPAPSAPPPPLTPAQLVEAQTALAQAEAEGLTLQRSERGCTGFKNVYYLLSNGDLHPYLAKETRDGKVVRIGVFATPEQAALSIARWHKQLGSAAKTGTEEALAQEETAVGAAGVPQVWPSPLPRSEAAAAALAAALVGAPRARPEQVQPPPLTPAQQEAAQVALAQAEAEGLTLQKSGRCSTGFANVYYVSNALIKSTDTPYMAKETRDGKQFNLGQFAAPEQAALCIARWRKQQPARAETAAAEASAQEETAAAAAAASARLAPLPRSMATQAALAAALNVARSPEEVASIAAAATAASAAGNAATGWKQQCRQAALAAARPVRPAPPPPTAAQLAAAQAALLQAEAEGLALVRSDRSATGFKHVYRTSQLPASRNPYIAMLKHGDKMATLGVFATAEEAALRVAQWRREQAASTATEAAVDEDVVVLEGEIVEDGDEEYVEVEAYEPGEDDNEEAFHVTVECVDAEDREEVSTEAAAAEDGVYTVEALVAQRWRGRKRQFLVRWLGYGRDDDTWEDEANILDPGLVRHFDLFVAGQAGNAGEKRGRPAASAAVPGARAEKLAKRNMIPAAAAVAAAAGNDCGVCVNCLDKPKFGGPGKRKSGCLAWRKRPRCDVVDVAAQVDASPSVALVDASLSVAADGTVALQLCSSRSLAVVPLPLRDDAPLRDMIPEPAAAAVGNDCGECVNCLDKPKFGGPGIKRKGCLERARLKASVVDGHSLPLRDDAPSAAARI